MPRVTVVNGESTGSIWIFEMDENRSVKTAFENRVVKVDGSVFPYEYRVNFPFLTVVEPMPDAG